MPATKDDIVRTLRESQQEIERAASSLPETAWSKGVYEAGWNARQLLCHLAAGASLASVQITVAKARSPGPGPSFDQDAFNAIEVAARQEMPVSDLLNELHSNFEQSIAAVEAATDDLLAASVQLPDGPQGALGDVILQAVREHTAMHLNDLRTAAV